MTFLHFKDSPNPGKKTKRWIIISKHSGDTLAWIEFYPAWRKYTWCMLPGVRFDVNCTKEVIQFLEEHKDDRNEL